MRYHIHILLVLLLVWCNPIRSQVLYEISGNGAKQRSYLLATNRLVDIQFLDTIPNLFKCWGKCNTLITEFSIRDYEAINTMRQAALLPDSVRLEHYYSEEEYLKIDESLRLATNMGMDKLARMKPSYLTQLYRDELMRKWLTYDELRSIETFFSVVAEQNKMPIHGLDDTGETIYMLFDREPFHHQCKELIQIIEYPEREVQLERKLTELYRNGRLNDMVYAVTGPDNLSTLSFSDYQLFAARNQNWVKRLHPYLNEGNIFITLNAIYLGGDKGLIACLRAAGYRVKPVNQFQNAKTTRKDAR